MKVLASVFLTLGVAGCVSFSGLDAASEYSCKAPPGMPCQSLSGVVANYESGNLPYQMQTRVATEPDLGPRKPGTPLPAEASSHGDKSGRATDAQDLPQAAMPAAPARDSDRRISPRAMEAPSSGMPIRMPPLVLRIWVAPWEDETGDLHDQSYIYTMINSGGWLIDANRSRIQQEYRPILAPRKNAAPPVSGSARPNNGDASAVAPSTGAQGS